MAARAAVLTGAAALLGLAAINPDAWIARNNLEREDVSTTPLDVDYLVYQLSADAVPVLVDGLPGGVPCAAAPVADDDWLEWNLGRARAVSALDDAGIEPCATVPVP